MRQEVFVDKQNLYLFGHKNVFNVHSVCVTQNVLM